MSRSFVTKYKGLSNVLSNKVGITNPTTTRLVNIDPNPQLDYPAIWDTGATNSVISKNLADTLGLVPIDVVITHGVHGPEKANVYFVDIWLQNRAAFMGVKVTEGKIKGFDVLIGMDIINQGDFAVSNKDGKTVFTFRVPSTHEIDFVEESRTPAHSTKISRNSPCPCGSGKKYKHCECKEYH